MSNVDEVVLGRDVTALAQSKGGAKGTVVLSVRIVTEDLKALDALARAENRTMSQLAREAFGCLVASRRRIDEMQGAAISVSPAAGGPKVLFHIGNSPGTGTDREDTQETSWDNPALIAVTA